MTATAARTGYPCGCSAPIVNAVGPETDQAATGARSFFTALFAGAVPEGRRPGVTVDRRAPQVFTKHPNIDAIATSAVGDDTAAEALPGRLTPSAWDGEPGYLAAIGGGDY